jgi:hypothetical protein
MIQDLRLAIRTLRRSPGFSCLAILCLTSEFGLVEKAYTGQHVRDQFK